ncbi:MAG: hypothetical protein P1P72_01075 [ANME-2 cluster archaeon]|nr:hypothetical protein [ANME-2 cluster archaeon]
MDSSSAGHKNLNSDASATVDPENKKCWACHVDGTHPTNQHPFGTPKTCIECHTGAGLMGAPIVHEHNQVGDEIRTTPDCSSCHNNSDMFIPYGVGADMLSHYVKKVTNMATTPYEHLGPINTSDYLNCHAGPNTGNPDWGSPVSIILNPNHPVATSNAECINGNPVQSNVSVMGASYNNSSTTIGIWNVSAIATNTNGSVMCTWTWKVMYYFSGFLSPIKTDERSIFKLGSIVPIKFQLRDATLIMT